MRWKQFDIEHVGTHWYFRVDETFEAMIVVHYDSEYGVGFVPLLFYFEDGWEGPLCSTLGEAAEVGHSMLLSLTVELIEQFNETNEKFRVELR